MSLKSIVLSLLTMAIATGASADRTVEMTLVHTTDVHGNFFPTDYINRRPGTGSMARVATYVDSLRAARGRENVILVDAGDILQGQPTVYYYNFIDTVSPHVAARVYNTMDYDAITVGNHDIETGHPVYDRFNRQLDKSLLAANVIDTSTGQPYFEPYRVIERNGIRFAILGLLTPAIPAWLPENIWSGMEFEDMETAARKWIPIIREREHPDVVIGLFHSGNDASRHTGDWIENASTLVAKRVPGFDIILSGHDHTRYNRVILGPDGGQVVVLNPANNADAVSRVDMKFTLDDEGRIKSRSFSGELVGVDSLSPSEDFMKMFGPEMAEVDSFVSRQIGEATGDFSARDAFFGNSAFIDLLHALQLQITGADISFAAPLSSDAVIAAGPVRVSDMFNLYKYENLLYTMRLTGLEIKDYLEESYSLWTRQIEKEGDHLINFASDHPTATDNKLRHAAYNFDSAAGIDYTVDVTKPRGEKITILGMSDGRPFDPEATYKVAVNSYRGNGGGDLLTRGAGIPHDSLASRVISATDRDMRYYLMKEIERSGKLVPAPGHNWSFVPADVAGPAIRRDRAILFSNKQ